VGMKRARARRREQAAAKTARDAQLAADMVADVKCTGCGRRFEGRGAYALGHDGGRCLPDGAFGQLVRLRRDGGVWATAWRHPEIRPE
jgi:hypothetical protein